MRVISLLVLLACMSVVVTSTNIVKHRRVLAHEQLAQSRAVRGYESAESDAEWVIPPFVAPGPNDCRSPCPALNTLANHGLLPHDGKGIDYAQLKTALIDIIGLGPAFGLIFANAATKKFATPATGTSTAKFSLCDLLINIHNSQQPSGSHGIEHSASLTREDRPDFSRASDPTQRSPSKAQVQILLDSSHDGQMITVADFLVARGKLWDKTYKAKPSMQQDKLKAQEHIIANVEGCLLLGALSGNSNKGFFQISKAYAQSILLDERLPAGWTKSTRSLGIPELFLCLAQQGVDWAVNEFTGMIQLSKNWFGLANLL